MAPGLLSCNGPREERPLSPPALFTVGARFLDDARTLAIKGSIEFADEGYVESGSFSLFLNGRDSLAFLIEGPFNLDLFRMIILEETAFVYSSADRHWLVSRSDQLFDVPEYGIEKISPVLLGVFVLPQYFLELLESGASSARLISYRHDREFAASRVTNGRSMTLIESDSDLIAVYRKIKNLTDGYYPSEVEIFDRTENWRMVLQIDKIRENVRLPDEIWTENR